jgi:hypothetical protein
MVDNGENSYKNGEKMVEIGIKMVKMVKKWKLV